MLIDEVDDLIEALSEIAARRNPTNFSETESCETLPAKYQAHHKQINLLMPRSEQGAPLAPLEKKIRR
jgi:hypothetical protein